MTTINPKYKQYGMIGVALVAIFGVVTLIVPEAETKRERIRPLVSNVLTDGNTREIGMDALVAKVETLQTELSLQQRITDKIEKDQGTIREGVGNSGEVSRNQAQLRSKVISQDKNIKDMQKIINKLERDLREVKKNPPVAPVAAKGEGEAVEVKRPGYKPAQTASRSIESASYHFEHEPDVASSMSRSEFESSDMEETTSQEIEISDVGEAVVEMASSNEEGEDEVSIYIPAGSIITGSLLNGLDAPTGDGARKDPFPVTMRIQHEAIMPGRFTADIRECHLILSGYGELSSERVMLRTEAIACVREDGKTLESKVNAYAVGEDSKAGIRSRLVTRQGQLIAKSMVAGFFSGMSGAFDVNPVPIVNTGETDELNWTDVDMGNAAQSGVVGGAQNSLDRIADFYLKWADKMFPVLELDAGRQIDVMTSRGFKLLIK